MGERKCERMFLSENVSVPLYKFVTDSAFFSVNNYSKANARRLERIQNNDNLN